MQIVQRQEDVRGKVYIDDDFIHTNDKRTGRRKFNNVFLHTIVLGTRASLCTVTKMELPAN